MAGVAHGGRWGDDGDRPDLVAAWGHYILGSHDEARFLRETADERLLVALNFSDHKQAISLPERAQARPLLSTQAVGDAGAGTGAGTAGGAIRLRPAEGQILTLVDLTLAE